MTFALWSLAAIALLYALDLLGVWLWLLDRAMRTVGEPVANMETPLQQVRRSGKFCRMISTLPTAIAPAAITIGRTIVLNDGTWLTPVLLRHEATHVRQWERYGVIGFLAREIYYQFKYGYGANPFEIEANAAE